MNAPTVQRGQLTDTAAEEACRALTGARLKLAALPTRSHPAATGLTRRIIAIEQALAEYGPVPDDGLMDLADTVGVSR